MKDKACIRAAIYCRLSEEDRDKAGEESESIQNQKAMLRQYATEQGWCIYNIYSDEDYTGADRSRPAFNQLLRDAQDKQFDVVLCKSQSRFTRELELVERYLHDLFPRWGIRFVGYADHADTSNRGNKKARQINGLVNEWYLEDLSDNIRTVFRSKQQQGLFIGSFAPYGYIKSEWNKNLLVPDEDAVAVVRRIFSLAAGGSTASMIAADLNRDKVPNPSTYKREKYPGFRRAGDIRTTWSAAGVRSILSNPVYQGDMRQHLREKANYKSNEVKRIAPENQIVVANSHQPIVTRELWQQAQKAMAGFTRHKAAGQGKDPVQAITRCSVCGRMLQIRYSHNRKYFVCKTDRVLVQAEQVRSFLDESRALSGQTEQSFESQKKDLLQRLQIACGQVSIGNMSDTDFAIFRRKWQVEWDLIEKQRARQNTKKTVLFVFPRKEKEKVPRMELVQQ